MSDSKPDSLTRKILKIYKNYGLDVSNVSDEEISRIRKSYEKLAKDIDADLKESEIFSGKFADNII